MSHLDEGTFHALLDGELDSAETRQIEAHLGRCTICGTRLDEIKNVRTEADRLIDSLGVGPSPVAPATATAATAPVTAVKPALRTPPSDAWAGPILLIPELPEDVQQEQRRKRRYRWAAIIVLAIGLTYGAIEYRSRSQAQALALSENGPTNAPTLPREPILSPQEATVPPTTPPPAPPSASDSGRDGGRDSSALASAPTPLSEVVTTATGPRRRLEVSNDVSAVAADVPKAKADAAASEERRALREQQQQQRQVTTPDEPAKPSVAAPTPAPVAVAPAPPTPPTLEERAHIYMRIGRDEAKGQLGGPVHGIEEMTPALIGLVPGRLSPGMDTLRPVIRAVYVDPVSSRLVFLDQQRLGSDQTSPPPSSLRAVLGDVVVQLQGEPNANVLRNLMPRVR